MNALKRLWAKIPPVAQAILEHATFAGLSAVVGAYFMGDLVFDDLNIHTVQQVFSLFLGAFVASLLARLGIAKGTGTGPALNSYESFQPPNTPQHREEGQVNLPAELVCLVILTVVVVLWWFGVRP